MEGQTDGRMHVLVCEYIYLQAIFLTLSAIGNKYSRGK